MYTLCLIWIIVIAYLSFVNGTHTKRSSERLYKILPVNMDLVRDLAHIVEFIILTTFLLSANLPVFIAHIVNLLSEILKPFVTTGRHCHLDDLGYNTIGIVLGCILYFIIQKMNII